VPFQKSVQATLAAEDRAKGFGVFTEDEVTPIPVQLCPLLATLKGESHDNIPLFLRSPGSPDGIYLSATSRPVVDDTGNILGGVCVFHNVTGIKQSEKTLRESQDRVTMAMDTAKMGVYEVDIATSRVLCDARLTALLGFGVDEPVDINKGIGRIHPDDRAYVSRQLDKAFDPRTGGLFSEEYRVCIPAGTTVWVTSRAKIYFNGEGDERHPVKMLGVCVDITEEKRAELELKESQYFLEKAQQIGKIGSWVSDLHSDGQLIWSKEVYEIFGLNKENFDGQVDTFFERVHPDDRQAVKKASQEVIKGQSSYDLDHRIIRPDGTLVWLHQRAELIHDGDGKPSKLIGVVKDITERKLAQEETLKLNAELEARVTARTAQLNELNKEFEAFAYSVSHDLNAPVRGINGLSLALFEDHFNKLDDHGKDYIRRIRAASKRMGYLIEDLLKLSRLTRDERGCEPVDLTGLASAIAIDFQYNEPERDVTWIIQPDMIADAESRLVQIMLENLLQNSWKFTSKHPHALIEIGSFEKDSKIVYYVRDDGAGFDMEYADKLFGPFQRFHTISEFEGNGIGLATVQRIVRRHGGTIWAESEIEQGTTIFFTLSQPEK